MFYDSPFGQFMHNAFFGFDFGIFSFFGLLQNDIFTFLAKFFSTFGEPIFMAFFFPFCLFLCCFKKTRKIGILLACGCCFFFLFNNIFIKNFAQRLRPYNVLQGNSEYFNWYMNAGQIKETAFCFPSGHTCFTFCIATILFFIIKKDFKKSECWMIFVIPFITACSRIYLMLHFPTDVIFGMLLGIGLGVGIWYLVNFAYNKIKNNEIWIKYDTKFDLQPIIENKFNIKFNASKVVFASVIFILISMTATFIYFSVSQANGHSCAHQGPDYVCMNKAKVKKYNENTNSWDYYCEIHE